MQIEDLQVNRKYKSTKTGKVFEFIKLERRGYPCFKPVENARRQVTISEEHSRVIHRDPELQGLVIMESVINFQEF